MTEAKTREVLNAFLEVHPEHVAGARIVNGEAVMDTECMIAFAHWSVKIGVTPKDVAERFLARIRGGAS